MVLEKSQGLQLLHKYKTIYFSLQFFQKSISFFALIKTVLVIYYLNLLAYPKWRKNCQVCGFFFNSPLMYIGCRRATVTDLQDGDQPSGNHEPSLNLGSKKDWSRMGCSKRGRVRRPRKVFFSLYFELIKIRIETVSRFGPSSVRKTLNNLMDMRTGAGSFALWKEAGAAGLVHSGAEMVLGWPNKKPTACGKF